MKKLFFIGLLAATTMAMVSCSADDNEPAKSTKMKTHADDGLVPPGPGGGGGDAPILPPPPPPRKP